MLLLVTVLLGILAGCGEATSPTMARVGNTNITEAQFTEYMEMNRTSFQDSQGLSPEQVRHLLFLQMINEEVGLEEARRNGYGIDSASEHQLDQQILSYIRQTSANPGSEPTFADFNKMAASDDFKMPSYRQLRQNFARQATLSQYAQHAPVDSGAEGAAHLVEVLVPVLSEEEAETARLEAAGYAAQLRAGASLSDITAKYAQDPQAGRFQGDIGWVVPSGAGPDLANVAASIPLNEWSDPVRTQLGWHVFKVVERGPFISWDALMGSQPGQEFIAAKVQEYKDRGDYAVYIDPASIPTPGNVSQ
jgi:parvulin-like peptidyl-prolyl isomerase